MSHVAIGFAWILVASVAGGAFGLQYRVMRRYTVENTSLISLFFATIVVPLIAAQFLLPGWTNAIATVGWERNLVIFAYGFAWGLGAITYAYGFNALGMALAATIIKGLSIAIGAGIPLMSRWSEVGESQKWATIAGLSVLLIGTLLAGKAGVLRERELTGGDPNQPKPNDSGEGSSGRTRASSGVFVFGLTMVLLSGVFSACANLGYDKAAILEETLQGSMKEKLLWKATLIRWMPMYWGGITALVIFMGGGMLLNGAWRNYFAQGSLRDLCIASTMGGVHFAAQIPYGIGAYYLDRADGAKLGTTVGWGVNIGMALIVATAIGFACGEWKGVSDAATHRLRIGIGVLLAAIAILAGANALGG